VVSSLVSLLCFLAQYARWVLVAGLATGLIFQKIAYLSTPYIPHFIALLLLCASFRIGPAQALGVASDLRKHLGITLLMQVVVPLLIAFLFWLIRVENVYVVALVLVAAAAPISGSPNLVIMLGHAPAPALRQLVIGTALLPFTVVPVFLLMPGFGSVLEIAFSAIKLLLIIGGASLLGFFLRWKWKADLSERNTQTVDGLSALLMALVVVGLMSALGDAWRHRPDQLLYMLVFVFALNFGLQAIGYRCWHVIAGAEYRVPLSVISGNRNVALYLTALPASVVDNLFLFVGCYQFPMYLTPLLLRRFYRDESSAETSP